MRIGIGTDIHRTIPGDHLTLGGVRIPAPYAVDAHSDGDVLLHAITDALLGALNAGDIGELFPDTAEENRGRASADFVAAAVKLMQTRNLSIINLDTVVSLEKPKLSAYKKKIAASIAQMMLTSPENVCVKAKTAEGLGAVGTGAAITAQAVVLIG